MIEISNEELAKVLNLWTGTEEWRLESGGDLLWDELLQRSPTGYVYKAQIDREKEAHALVNFMLKERKYPDGDCVSYTSDRYGPLRYVEWVKDWEAEFGGMSQEELCIPPSEQIVETVEMPVCQDITGAPRTKAERFYSFLATPQLDISPGLWGIAAMAGAPVRGGDYLGWAMKDVGGLTRDLCKGGWTVGDGKGSPWHD